LIIIILKISQSPRGLLIYIPSKKIASACTIESETPSKRRFHGAGGYFEMSLSKRENFGGDIMKCPNCQFENREDAKFRKECGPNLELACSGCGTAYEIGSKFCDEF
jgi:hypothetical protein